MRRRAITMSGRGNAQTPAVAAVVPAGYNSALSRLKGTKEEIRLVAAKKPAKKASKAASKSSTRPKAGAKAAAARKPAAKPAPAKKPAAKKAAAVRKPAAAKKVVAKKPVPALPKILPVFPEQRATAAGTSF